MVSGSDTSFTAQITRAGLTLQGIYMVGSKVGQIADRICQGKVVELAGSGYDPKGILFPRGWLGSICGLTASEVALEQLYPLAAALRSDYGLAETGKIVEALRVKLASPLEMFRLVSHAGGLLTRRTQGRSIASVLGMLLS